MAQNKRGRHSFILPEPAVITAWASVAGKKEAEGPLSHTFDKTSQDTYFGQSSWELAEKAMQETLAKFSPDFVEALSFYAKTFHNALKLDTESDE